MAWLENEFTTYDLEDNMTSWVIGDPDKICNVIAYVDDIQFDDYGYMWCVHAQKGPRLYGDSPNLHEALRDCLAAYLLTMEGY